MTLYLSNKQLLLLFIPVIIVGALLYFEDDILRYMHSVLPQHTMKKSEILTEEANKYLQINRDRKKYDGITKKIISRKEFIRWMQNHSLYKKSSLTGVKREQKSVPKNQWRLEAVFPKYDKAIINDKFVHVGSVVNNAKVIKIGFDKVLLKTVKGLKWVHLFH